MEIEIIEICGWKGAFRGMRNSHESWDEADSYMAYNEFHIGPNDMKLAKKLIKGDRSERKFLRMIHVQIDVAFPRYIWSEFDTYHFNTKNSTSTMHTLLGKKPVTKERFVPIENNKRLNDLQNEVIGEIEVLRQLYQASKKTDYVRQAKRILPESFLQMRTVDTNYEELANMYFQRRTHRLPEWKEFCAWIETLPYFKEMILDE